MDTRRWLAFVALALAGLTLLVVSAMLSHSSVAVAAVPSTVPRSTPTRIPTSVPRALLAAPDLIVESITFSPAHPNVRESVDITVTVKNQGDASAHGFYTYLYVDPADQPPTQTTTDTSRYGHFLTFPPGDSFHWTRTNHTFAISGTYCAYAWVDRDDDVPESDETNNLAGPVCIPVGITCGPDEYEDDDLCERANPIAADGVEQYHNLCLDLFPDKDWARFDAVAGVTYRAQAIADGADADLEIELHGGCSSPPSFGSGSEIEFTAVQSGPHYFKVRHHEDVYGPDTDYRLRVAALAFCNGYDEPNDMCVWARDIAVNEAPQPHTFCRAGDADWVRFPTTAGSTYVVSATSTGASADPQLSLHTRCNAPPAVTDGRRLTYTVAHEGFAYVKAVNSDPSAYGPGTEYALQVVWAGDCAPDAYEEDDTAAAAGTLAVGDAAQTHDVCPAGDADWARFSAVAGLTYTLETFNLGGAADTVLCLFDANGTAQLACDDDSGPGNGSRLVWQAPSSGVYTLRVTDYDPQAAGPETRYDLHVFVGPCLRDALEPDDTQAGARPIAADGSRQPHNVCPVGDVDWVKFTAQARPYVIETTDLGPEADTFIELYDAAGQRLAFNDDYGPGTASRIHYTFGDGGTYYVRVRHYDPARYGTGTGYSLRVYPGDPPDPPTPPPPPPTIEPPPPGSPSDVRTIILVNRAQVVALYGEPAATQLITKLETLAVHDDVKGEVIRLDLNDAVNAAYAAWTLDSNNVARANQVAAAIRGVIMTYLQQRAGVEYVVLVGDDRLLPFRRIADHTSCDGRGECVERDYVRVSADHPTGAALRANYFLSDDYYGDRDPVNSQGREFYIPDLAVGRLIETPDEIGAFIDTFLANSQVIVDKVLVTGYDFVQDAAEAICEDWRAELAGGKVDCTLIGGGWTPEELRERQLDAVPPFRVQSINGHANHHQEGTPAGGHLDASEIASSTLDMAGGLIYTPGCHAGLNVPPANITSSLDLAQAFVQKKANYVGNTGYGWGVYGGIGLSERLMHLYTGELRSGKSTSMGQALVGAKQRYCQENQGLTDYDEKVLEELIFYGLPMVRLNTSAISPTLGPPDDPFPSVDVISNLPSAFGDETVISGTVRIQLVGALGPGDVMSRVVTTDGAYYLLDGHAHVAPGQPAQPLVYADVTATGWPARSVVFWGGEYETLDGFDPVVISPVNHYFTQTAEAAFDEPGWFPPAPVVLQSQGKRTSLVAQMGQYDPATRQERLYGAVELDLYYSLSADQTPPQCTAVAGLYNRITGRVNVKVDATDPAGVRRVVATYTQGDGHWDSVELSFNSSLDKWTGSFPGDTDLRYFVQVVDGAGNVAQVTRKGLYFVPAADPAPTISVYLPVVLRQ